MPVTVIPSYRNALLTGAGLDLSTATLKAVLVTANHVAELTATGDEFLSEIPSTERVLTSAGFTPTVSGTNVDAADGVTLNDPGNGKTSSQAYVYVDTGDEATSRLLMHDDTVELTSDGTNDNLGFDPQGLFDL